MEPVRILDENSANGITKTGGSRQRRSSDWRARHRVDVNQQCARCSAHDGNLLHSETAMSPAKTPASNPPVSRSKSRPRPPAKRPRTNGGPRGGRPLLKGAALEDFVIEQASQAAYEEKASAIHDLLESTAPADAVRVLQSVLGQQRGLAKLSRTAADRELAPDWQYGGYPYKNLMSRKSYGRQKFRLQVELLKLQAWVKETGQRIVVLFEGRDAAGRAARSNASCNTSIRGAHAWSRLTNPAMPSAASGISSVMWSTCQPRPRSSCSTAPGTTAPGVENVMGFCTDPEYQEFMRQAPEFERMLVRQNIHLFKFWFYSSIKRPLLKSRAVGDPIAPGGLER